MSASAPVRSLTAPDIRARKQAEAIVCITAYSAEAARWADRHCDVILVGDSVGMVVHGLPSTVGVTMEMMILHGQAVRRGAARALVVVDMPFGSYEESPQQAFRNAARLMAETGCGAVKLEGGTSMEETIRFLTARGIPVMGHSGLTPQSYLTAGGYRVQGKTGESLAHLKEAALQLEEAGCFGLLLELVESEAARVITESISIPTIGIGAGPQPAHSMSAGRRLEMLLVAVID